MTGVPNARRRVAFCMATLLFVTGCDKMLTEKPAEGTRFDQPLPGLSNGELGQFQRGDTQFQRGFTVSDGLGPVFNNRSCASCHSGDGRGSLENILVRFSRAGDLIPGEGGPQIQDKAIPGAEPERLPAGVEVSRRLPPAVFGMGLIEAVTESLILTRSDPTDSNGDGISGRPNWVTPPSYLPAGEPGGGASPRIGRFGRKAQVSSVLQQVVEAYHQDMGVTSSFRPLENLNPQSSLPQVDQVGEPEVGDGEVGDVADYVRMLAPPAPGEWTESRRHGEAMFTAARCIDCHVPTLRTGWHEFDPVANHDIAIFSDLLLHDMGDALADNRPDGSADGREWRTAPLWGMRVVREFLGGRLLLLHDGRATSVDEAIRLHGGEAAASRDAYLAMPSSDRAAVVEFVESR